MSRIILSFYLFCILITFSSCNGNDENRLRNLDEFSKLSNNDYVINSQLIRKNINKLIKNDGVLLAADRHVIKYYSENRPFIWIYRLGVYNRADTLLKIIQEADFHGFGTKMLKISQIKKDLERIKNLNVSPQGSLDNINVIMARLEYNLTKALFRYSVGLRYGLINPNYLYNNLETYYIDSTSTRFRQLSDLKVERPDNKFYASVIIKAQNDSLKELFSSIHPQGNLYKKLIEHLNNHRLSNKDRLKTLCNIERCRWRFRILPKTESYKKYIEVNIPSFSLRAIDNKNILTMRIGCGMINFKTPLITSKITRMDINPQWIIPKSIAKGIAGNFQYMHKMGMFILDKKLGKLPPEKASYNKIMNGEQFIIQAGGPKNSLGRIIFRFDNNFSVFLHDTSSPWLFKHEKRAISHGCIRVEKPFELALFLLNNKSKELKDKLRYSMTVEFMNDNDSLNKKKVDKKRMINSVSVNPPIPLFITYFTKYLNENGQLTDYEDIYEYDNALYDKLKPFVE